MVKTRTWTLFSGVAMRLDEKWPKKRNTRAWENWSASIVILFFFFAGVKFSFLVRISTDFHYFGLILSPKILINLPQPAPKLSKPSLTPNLFT